MHTTRRSSRFSTSRILWCLLGTSLAVPGAVRGGGADLDNSVVAARFDNPSCSPDGKWIAMSDASHHTLYLHDWAAKTTIRVAGSPSGAYAYNWSPDGRRLAHKRLVSRGQGQFPMQIPVIFDVDTRESLSLCSAAKRAGVPSFSADGQIAYTVDEELRITDGAGTIVKTLALDNYANLAPISPDGTKVAYNDRHDRICLIELTTGEKTVLTNDENAYFNPVWSPDSSRLIVSTISGQLKTIDTFTSAMHELGEGRTPSWAPDSRTVFFSKIDRIEGVMVNRADICRAQFDGSGMTTLTQDAAVQATAARVAADGSKIAFVSPDGEIYQAPVLKEKNTGKTRTTLLAGFDRCSLGHPARIDSSGSPSKRLGGAASAKEGSDQTTEPTVEAAKETSDPPLLAALQTTVSTPVPYIHQVYDTPDNFNGHWACNATSAAMCLAYCGKLSHWDVTCSTPYSHVSHYGRYICQIYTYNGHTYNIGSPDASGVTAYGGYGYIVRNNWADTKGYMRDYFNNHGDSSSVDWSPTWAKLQTEINAQHPFVLLNSLTTSGHYIVAIGWVDGQHTGIFNDPYGNKNSGYMNYYGAGVRYDWPGYNNGYSNLNTVHCFIYSRADPPSTWAASYVNQSYPSTMTAGETAVVWAEFLNDGTGHWRHGETRLGTSSPQDRTSPFCTSYNWVSCNRPTDVDQSDVAQGQVGRFSFILTAPATPGTYVEKYKLVREGITWFGPEITWTITVTASQGNLNGTVTNASTGSAIAGATVSLSGIGSTTTNSSGAYAFNNVAAGSYPISVSATGFNTANDTVSINAGATTTKDFALIPSDTQAPSTPTDLTATAMGPTTVSLTWNASTDNVGVTGYDVRRNGAVIGSTSATSYTDSGASPLTTYSYEVRAKDAVPNYSGWSNTAEVTTPPNPPLPTIVFSDGFNGNLNNWVQQTQNYDYSTAANHGTYTGGGSAYCGAGQSDQMYHAFSRPFAQGKAWGWFWDGKGGWKATVCGNSYRQAFSLRDMDNAAKMFIDNEFYNTPDNSKYYYRIVGAGGIGHTIYANRDPNTDCNGTWVYFETTVTAGAPGANPAGTIQVKVADRAGTTTAAPSITSDFYDWGIGRITLGLGVTCASECYWDDVAFEATPPGVPAVNAPVVISASEIRWDFAPADYNSFGLDVADGSGTMVSPQYPNAGWINRNATSWTETGLAANTQYTRKVRAWNGTLNSAAFSANAVAYTLSPAPTAESVTPDNAEVCVGDTVAWTAVGGFKAGKVQYYTYAWDQNPDHTFDGSEPVWSAGTIAVPASAPGTWYLHVQGFNAADVANGTYSYGVTAAPTTAVTQPPANVTVCPAVNTSFNLTAVGGSLAYQWQKNGEDINDDAHYSGTHSATLAITGVTADDVAVYRCIVTGTCGEVISLEADLTLLTATTILQQPQPATECSGTPVTLSVQAVGDEPLSYQWQKNGSDIPGAVYEALLFTPASPANSGNYRCVVTATCGSVTSDEVALTVAATVAADFDGDCDVDDDDFDAFETCASGPGVPLEAGCEGKDLDLDNDIDQADFSLFQRCVSGSEMPIDPECMS